MNSVCIHPNIRVQRTIDNAIKNSLNKIILFTYFFQIRILYHFINSISPDTSQQKKKNGRSKQESSSFFHPVESNMQIRPPQRKKWQTAPPHDSGLPSSDRVYTLLFFCGLATLSKNFHVRPLTEKRTIFRFVNYRT